MEGIIFLIPYHALFRNQPTNKNKILEDTHYNMPTIFYPYPMVYTKYLRNFRQLTGCFKLLYGKSKYNAILICTEQCIDREPTLNEDMTDKHPQIFP